MYYVYLLESETDGRYYIGHTQDLKECLKYHNSGRSVYTKHRGPWRLLAYKTFKTRSGAMKAERHIKRLKNRNSIRIEFNIKA